MKFNTDTNFDVSPEDQTLETADAVARAAHIWIRSVCLNEWQCEEDRSALAGGLVAGLCERLSLNPRVRDLVAYVYTLLDNETSQALAVSRMMLDKPVPRNKREAYERGRSEAAGIVEMLSYHDNNSVRSNDYTQQARH
jgi:hypothetical protein